MTRICELNVSHCSDFMRKELTSDTPATAPAANWYAKGKGFSVDVMVIVYEDGGQIRISKIRMVGA